MLSSYYAQATLKIQKDIFHTFIIQCLPLFQINGYIRSFARHPQLIKKNRAELDYLREQLLTSILHQKRLIQLEHLRSYEIEINVTAGNMVAPIYVINNVDLSVVPSNFQHTSLNIPTEGVVVNEEPIIWCECADNCRGEFHRV